MLTIQAQLKITKLMMVPAAMLAFALMAYFGVCAMDIPEMRMNGQRAEATWMIIKSISSLAIVLAFLVFLIIASDRLEESLDLNH